VPQPRDHPAATLFMETVIQDHTPLADYLKGEPALLFALRKTATASENAILDTDTIPPGR
jgi:hypothetical protein